MSYREQPVSAAMVWAYLRALGRALPKGWALGRVDVSKYVTEYSVMGPDSGVRAILCGCDLYGPRLEDVDGDDGHGVALFDGATLNEIGVEHARQQALHLVRGIAERAAATA